MGRRSLEYPKNARNTVNRNGKSRGTYDLGVIHTIFNTSMVVHVSFAPGPDDPFPAILPMIGVLGSFSFPSASLEEPQDCYLHGYVSSRIMKLARKSATDGSEGLAVCIASTEVDGLVLSLTPNSHSYNYRSAVLFGHATLVTEVDEKLWAMELITNKVVHNRWANTRVPPNGAEMSSTQILRVKITSGSGKIREGPPGDEMSDLEDDALLDRVWTGYIPLVQQLGEPVPSMYNKLKEVPKHILLYRESYNKQSNERVKQSVKKVSESNTIYGGLEKGELGSIGLDFPRR